MIKLLTPIICLAAGLAVGVGTARFLAPDQDAKAVPETKAAASEAAGSKTSEPESKAKASEKAGKAADFEYLKLTKQFVVPIVEDDQIAAMVTMSLSLEANPSITEDFYAIEPKLRDGFLRVLFDHANSGGFDGVFTQSDNLGVLRKSLLEIARKDLGDDVSQVLIMSVNRQDT